jgi:uncharacterized Zn finger protein (UPF0148 family)
MEDDSISKIELKRKRVERDYAKLLIKNEKIGKMICPDCGEKLKKHLATGVYCPYCGFRTYKNFEDK